jgi:hypothetical protein
MAIEVPTISLANMAEIRPRVISMYLTWSRTNSFLQSGWRVTEALPTWKMRALDTKRIRLPSAHTDLQSSTSL